jgi:hypothetical protein
MADTDINIVVTATDKASAGLKGIRGSIITMNQGLQLAQQAFNAVKNVVDASIGAYVKYADQVRRLSQLNGTSAQETSRLIQVMDDHKVTVEALTMATRKLAQQGESLTIDSLAKMSDAYLSLGNQADKTKFLLDKFGRSGFQLAETMNLGSAAINAESAAISKNLIMTQKQLDMARKYERMLDEVSDTTRGYTVLLGTKLLPLQIGLYRKLIEGTDAWGGFGGQLQQIADILMTRTNPALVGFGTAMAYARGFLNMPGEALNMWLGLDEIIEEVAVDLGKVGEEAEAIDFSGSLNSLIAFSDNYKQTQEDLGALEEELADKRKRGYSETGRTVLEIKGKIEEVKAAQTEWTNRFILDMAMMQAAAGGLDPTEAAGLMEMAVQLGIIDRKAIDFYNSLMKINGLDVVSSVTTIYYKKDGGYADAVRTASGSLRRASGGSIPAGGMAWVGDSPGGLTPYSELVYAPHGAQVFKASESRAMASGAPRAAMGGSIPAMTGETNLSYSTIRQLASAIAGEMSRING